MGGAAQRRCVPRRGLAVAAGAQDQPQTVQVPPTIVAVDARANTNATVIVRSAEEIVDPQVVVNKTPVEVTSVKKPLEAGTKINTVLVIDNSEDSGTFAFKEIKAAAVNFLNSSAAGRERGRGQPRWYRADPVQPG